MYAERRKMCPGNEGNTRQPTNGATPQNTNDKPECTSKICIHVEPLYNRSDPIPKHTAISVCRMSVPGCVYPSSVVHGSAHVVSSFSSGSTSVQLFLPHFLYWPWNRTGTYPWMFRNFGASYKKKKKKKKKQFW